MYCKPLCIVFHNISGCIKDHGGSGNSAIS